MKQDNYKRWLICTIIIITSVIAIIILTTIYIDPVFHYHKPYDNVSYILYDERYQNDGIVRNFEYDAIITGTSMTQNFKTSECDRLFNCSSIKTSFSGASFEEINDHLKRAFSKKDHINIVIRGLDYYRLFNDSSSDNGFIDPTYLKNDSITDDLQYLLNKDIFVKLTSYDILYTILGKSPTSFDEYANWSDLFLYGPDIVKSTYTRAGVSTENKPLTDIETQKITTNLRNNIIELAEEHPDTTFYLFFTPYSICYWDSISQPQREWMLHAEEVVIETLLDCPNICLYSFNNNFDLVCNLNNYKDVAHYGEWVNSDILQWMHDGEYLLSKDNYKEYMRTVREFYLAYDYDSIYGGED